MCIYTEIIAHIEELLVTHWKGNCENIFIWAVRTLHYDTYLANYLQIYIL